MNVDADADSGVKKKRQKKPPTTTSQQRRPRRHRLETTTKNEKSERKLQQPSATTPGAASASKPDPSGSLVKESRRHRSGGEKNTQQSSVEVAKKEGTHRYNSSGTKNTTQHPAVAQRTTVTTQPEGRPQKSGSENLKPSVKALDATNNVRSNPTGERKVQLATNQVVASASKPSPFDSLLKDNLHKRSKFEKLMRSVAKSGLTSNTNTPFDCLEKDNERHRLRAKKKSNVATKRSSKPHNIAFDSLVVTVPQRTSATSSVSSIVTMEDIWDIQPARYDNIKVAQVPPGVPAKRTKRRSSAFASTSLNKVLMSCTPQKIQQDRDVSLLYNPTTTRPDTAKTAAATAIATATIGTTAHYIDATLHRTNTKKVDGVVPNHKIDIKKLQSANYQAGSTEWWEDTNAGMKEEAEEWMGNIRKNISPSETFSKDSPPKKVRITLDDFDIDHLSFLQDEAYNDDGENSSSESEEDSCEDSERWIVKHLEKNSSFLYWLQLTTELKEPRRLIQAMTENKTIRNATVYPAVFQELSFEDKNALVAAICKIPKLQNLIVFHDCGNLFLEPLIKFQPPLRRLTLYKLDIPEERLLSQLPRLLRKFPSLEDLAIEKYKGTEGGQLLLVMAGVLPTLPQLKTLSLTPAKNVQISKTGTFCFFRALANNRSIRTLSLQGSEDSIDQTCIHELVNTLQVNYTLEDIKLTGFWRKQDAFWKRFEPKSKEQITYYTKLNQAGIRNLQLDVNASFERLQSALVSHKDNLDHVFYLLLNNPAMVQTAATRWRPPLCDKRGPEKNY